MVAPQGRDTGVLACRSFVDRHGAQKTRDMSDIEPQKDSGPYPAVEYCAQGSVGRSG